MNQRYRARWLLTPEGLKDHWEIVVQNGRVASIGPASPGAEDLGDVLVVAGLVNAHSHAFQRAIRGRTEFVAPQRPDDNFWSWRERMYATALALSPEDVEIVSAMAFLEMALSGITSVGEFHYLHHQPDGTPYAEPNILADAVIRAARRVGIRIALLRVAYHRAGFKRPDDPLQRRFIEPNVETYLARAEALATSWAGDSAVTIGLAPHSIRAVPGPWLSAIAAHAVKTGRVVHIHACEQRSELVQAKAEYGVGPVAAFENLGVFEAQTTLVHGTHLDADALSILARRRPVICACPTTERNLGDGFLPAETLLARGVPIALGTDSQADINLWSEMRLVEYHARLQQERRNVLAPYGAGQTSAALWPMATQNGAQALGLPVGVLKSGSWADFVTIDLDAPQVAGTGPDHWIDALAFSVGPSTVRDVFVAGEPIVRAHRHSLQAQIIKNWRELAVRLDGRESCSNLPS